MNPTRVRRTSPVPLLLLLLSLLLLSPLPAQLPGGGGTTGESGAGSIADLQKGIRLLRSGESSAAKEHFAAMADREPHSAMPRYYLALAFAALEDGPACLDALGAAAERGWPRPEELAGEAAFAPFAEKDETFRAGLDRLAAAWRARNEEGLLPGHTIPAVTWTDDAGAEHPLVERGRPTAILFVRAGEPEDIAALWALEAEAARAGAAFRAVVLVECAEKEEGERRERLARYRAEMKTALPCGLVTEEQKRVVRPFRAWPTLLAVDAHGRAIRAVEGSPADLAARYARILGGEPREEPAPEGGADPPARPKADPPPPG